MCFLLFTPSDSFKASLSSLVLSNTQPHGIDIQYKELEELFVTNCNDREILDFVINMLLQWLNSRNTFIRAASMSYNSLYYRESEKPNHICPSVFVLEVDSTIVSCLPSRIKLCYIRLYVTERMLHLILFNGVSPTRVNAVFDFFSTLLEYLFLIKAARDYPSRNIQRLPCGSLMKNQSE